MFNEEHRGAKPTVIKCTEVDTIMDTPPNAPHHAPAAQHAPAPARKGTPVAQQSSEQLAQALLNTRSGVRTILAASTGVETPWGEHGDTIADLTEAALHKTVDNGWFVDLPDVLLNIQHRNLPIEASVGTLTDITNNARAGIKAADGHYYINCTTRTNCNVAPVTRDELKRALGTAPLTPAMSPDRSVRISNPTAAIAGYLSASVNPAQYAWGNPDGSRMSVSTTVNGMLTEKSAAQTHAAFRACLMSGNDDSMQSCARAGIRQGLIDRVNKVASR